jgi:pimeloyl-ACP methyl ester carboxylesterase
MEMKTFWVFSAFAAVAMLAGGCRAKQPEALKETNPQPAPAAPGAQAENVTFATDDGWTLAGSYWDAGAGKPAALLVHMLPADRRSYDDFAPKVAAAGFNVLAFDSRGHGESLKHNGAEEHYTSFDAAAYNASVSDLAAAKKFLAAKGADTTKIVIVGASIGANFALIYGAGDADVKAVALLSPGLDYHGVKTGPAITTYGARPVYLVASDEDKYSAESVGALRKVAPGATSKIFSHAGHGTNIFGAEPAFADELVTWLSSQVK